MYSDGMGTETYQWASFVMASRTTVRCVLQRRPRSCRSPVAEESSTFGSACRRDDLIDLLSGKLTGPPPLGFHSDYSEDLRFGQG
jgi:hypothetical protein